MQGYNHYIWSKESNECAIFNSFGSLVKLTTYKDGLSHVDNLTSCRNVRVLSISGKPAVKTDLYYNGKRANVSVNSNALFQSLFKSTKHLMMSSIPYRMTGIDNIPITILVYREGIGIDELLKLAGVECPSVWTSCVS